MKGEQPLSITITNTEIKRKAMISVSDYDTSITSLISEMQPALEYSITDTYLNDTGNTNLQATLKLGILEMITGEFLEQLRREAGAADEFSVAGITVGAAVQTGVELIQQGATRLAPFLKAALPMLSDTNSAISNEDEPVFSADEEVW